MPDVDRYRVERSYWRRSGPRKGIFRIKSLIYVTELLGKYTFLKDAQTIFDSTSAEPGEYISLRDSKDSGFLIAHKYAVEK